MNMIRVMVADNMRRETVIVEDTKTLRQVFEDNGIDYSRGMSTLDGLILRPGDMDKSFADFGVTENCSLYSVAKTDNAR